VSPSAEPRSWPGLDGWVLVVLAAVLVCWWLVRGRVGPDLHVGVLLLVDAAYLGATWWSRR